MEYQEVIRCKLLSVAELKFPRTGEGERAVSSYKNIAALAGRFYMVRSNLFLAIIDKVHLL